MAALHYTKIKSLALPLDLLFVQQGKAMHVALLVDAQLVPMLPKDRFYVWQFTTAKELSYEQPLYAGEIRQLDHFLADALQADDVKISWGKLENNPWIMRKQETLAMWQARQQLVQQEVTKVYNQCFDVRSYLHPKYLASFLWSFYHKRDAIAELPVSYLLVNETVHETAYGSCGVAPRGAVQPGRQFTNLFIQDLYKALALVDSYPAGEELTVLANQMRNVTPLLPIRERLDLEESLMPSRFFAGGGLDSEADLLSPRQLKERILQQYHTRNPYSELVLAADT